MIDGADLESYNVRSTDDDSERFLISGQHSTSVTVLFRPRAMTVVFDRVDKPVSVGCLKRVIVVYESYRRTGTVSFFSVLCADRLGNDPRSARSSRSPGGPKIVWSRELGRFFERAKEVEKKNYRTRSFPPSLCRFVSF